VTSTAKRRVAHTLRDLRELVTPYEAMRMSCDKDHATFGTTAISSSRRKDTDTANAFAMAESGVFTMEGYVAWLRHEAWQHRHDFQTGKWIPVPPTTEQVMTAFAKAVKRQLYSTEVTN